MPWNPRPHFYSVSTFMMIYLHPTLPHMRKFSWKAVIWAETVFCYQICTTCCSVIQVPGGLVLIYCWWIVDVDIHSHRLELLLIWDDRGIWVTTKPTNWWHCYELIKSRYSDLYLTKMVNMSRQETSQPSDMYSEGWARPVTIRVFRRLQFWLCLGCTDTLIPKSGWRS